MRTLLIATASLILSLPLAAQTAKPTPPKGTPGTAPAAPAATPPTIVDAQRAQFFKIQSQATQAAEYAKSKQSEFQSVVADMQKTCGDAFTLTMNQAQDPVCVAKPAPAEAKK